LGQIPLITFVNPAGLQSKGGNLYVETAASGAPVENVGSVTGVGKIKQFTLEMSNVSAVEELVNMISVQRAYEMNSKVISAADQMMQFANQTLVHYDQKTSVERRFCYTGCHYAQQNY
jgi:flagellar basal-body rod protein FlgG